MGAAPSDPAFRRIGGGIQSDNRKDDIYQGFSEAARKGRPWDRNGTDICLNTKGWNVRRLWRRLA